MSISEKFNKFNSTLRMTDVTISNIRYRTKQITKRVNNDFRSLDSDTRYSLYVGSYGRGTEIRTSDIDLIVELPYSEYKKYNEYHGNGQSALLQALKASLQRTYSTTHMRGDGQVVSLNFDDGICFEIVPGFINKDSINYTYPDTNSGGSWKITKPREEATAINVRNNSCNKNLKRLCRMARAWKSTWSVPIGGLLIDTLAYNFMGQWEYRDKTSVYYDWMTRDFFQYLKNQNSQQEYWSAPGSSQRVKRKGPFEYKALRCYNISLEALDYEEKKMNYSANAKWREIYGSKFPS